MIVSCICTGSDGLDSAVLRFASIVDDTSDRTSDVDKEPLIDLSIVESSTSLASTLEPQFRVPLCGCYIFAVQTQLQA